MIFPRKSISDHVYVCVCVCYHVIKVIYDKLHRAQLLLTMHISTFTIFNEINGRCGKTDSSLLYYMYIFFPFYMLLGFAKQFKTLKRSIVETVQRIKMLRSK